MAPAGGGRGKGRKPGDAALAASNASVIAEKVRGARGVAGG